MNKIDFPPFGSRIKERFLRIIYSWIRIRNFHIKVILFWATGTFHLSWTTFLHFHTTLRYICKCQTILFNSFKLYRFVILTEILKFFKTRWNYWNILFHSLNIQFINKHKYCILYYLLYYIIREIIIINKFPQEKKELITIADNNNLFHSEITKRHVTVPPISRRQSRPKAELTKISRSRVASPRIKRRMDAKGNS